MEWYELSEQEKIRNVYSKYSIKDFWDWWCNDNSFYMEIRIKDFKLIKQVAKYFDIPFSASGVYVNNALQLKNVISAVRDIATVWFGINPRKNAYTEYGKKRFAGDDYHVQSINHIFIDIDRLEKKGPATNKELENADRLANLILERLQGYKWNERYVKICSGNGVQLLISLDVPIAMPLLDFDMKYKSYTENEDYELTKQLIRETIGKQLKRFAMKYKDELKVDIDMAGFKIGQVGALPVTKNYKYDGFTWRGIIDMKSGINDGLGDYIYSKRTDIKTFHDTNPFKVKMPKVNPYLIRGNLRDDPLVKLMLDNQLPYGMINNKIWFSLKLLLRDSNIDLKSEEFKKVHRELEEKYKGKFTLNMPNKKYKFDIGTVNNYCIELLIPPVYKFKADWYIQGYIKYTHNWDFLRDNTVKVILYDTETEDDIQDKNLKIVPFRLRKDTDIHEDMKEFKSKVLELNTYNNDNVGAFINGCIKKYGEKATRYYFDYLFEQFFTHSK